MTSGRLKEEPGRGLLGAEFELEGAAAARKGLRDEMAETLGSASRVDQRACYEGYEIVQFAGGELNRVSEQSVDGGEHRIERPGGTAQVVRKTLRTRVVRELRRLDVEMMRDCFPKRGEGSVVHEGCLLGDVPQ